MSILDELAKLEQAATKGPWEVDAGHCGNSDILYRNPSSKTDGQGIRIIKPFAAEADAQDYADAALIAAARNALPALLKVARAAKALRNAVVAGVMVDGWESDDGLDGEPKDSLLALDSALRELEEVKHG